MRNHPSLTSEGLFVLLSLVILPTQISNTYATVQQLVFDQAFISISLTSRAVCRCEASVPTYDELRHDPSNAGTYVSPLCRVPNSTQDQRSCGDYRDLNKVVNPEMYPVSHAHDFFNKISPKVLPCDVMISGSMAEVYVSKAAFTKQCSSQFTMMLFGLIDVAWMSRSSMDEVLHRFTFFFV